MTLAVYAAVVREREAGLRSNLKEVPAFEPFVVCAPDDLFVSSRQKRHMLGTVDVRLFHADDNPRLGLPAALVLRGFSHAGRDVGEPRDVLWVGDARGSVHVKSDSGLIVVEKNHADVRILENVSHAGQHPIASIFGIRQRLVIQHLHKTRRAGAE